MQIAALLGLKWHCVLKPHIFSVLIHAWMAPCCIPRVQMLTHNPTQIAPVYVVGPA